MPACPFITTEELYLVFTQPHSSAARSRCCRRTRGGSCIPPPIPSTSVDKRSPTAANEACALQLMFPAASCILFIHHRLQSLSRSHFQPSFRIQFTRLSPLPHLDHIMASRQRGPKPSESLIDPAYYHKCDYQTSNSSSFADPQVVYSKTYKEKVLPELQQDLRSRPLLTSTSYVGNATRNTRL
jgi:hypothetical protein